MKTHGRLKASITVETALVLPIVFGGMFAVLFFVYIMFQSTVTTAIVDADALRSVNYSDPDNIRDGSGNPLSISFLDGKSLYNINRDTQSQGNFYRMYNVLQMASMIIKNLKMIHPGGPMYPPYDDPQNGGSAYVEDLYTPSQASLIGRLQGSNEIKTVGTAPLIYPSRYIRETDSKSALFTAYITISDETWTPQLFQFVSAYLATLFTEGTIE